MNDKKLTLAVKNLAFDALLKELGNQKNGKFSNEEVTTRILQVFKESLVTDDIEWEDRKKKLKDVFLPFAGRIVGEAAAPVLKDLMGDIAGEGKGLLEDVLHKFDIFTKDGTD